MSNQRPQPLADVGALEHAVLRVERPWLVAAIFTFVPTVFVVFGLMIGSIAAQRNQGPSVTGATGAVPLLVGAMTAFVAAALAVLVMARTPIPLSRYGFSSPRHRAGAAVWVALGLALAALAAGVLHLPAPRGEVWGWMLLDAAAMAASVLWTGGPVLAVMRTLELRRAVLGTAALGCVLPVVLLLMAMGGVQTFSVLLTRTLLAVLLVVVATLLVVVCASLWPGLGIGVVASALAALGANGSWSGPLRLVACLLLVLAAGLLWRRLPASAAAARR